MTWVHANLCLLTPESLLMKILGDTGYTSHDWVPATHMEALYWTKCWGLVFENDAGIRGMNQWMIAVIISQSTYSFCQSPALLNKSMLIYEGGSGERRTERGRKHFTQEEKQVLWTISEVVRLGRSTQNMDRQHSMTQFPRNSYSPEIQDNIAHGENTVHAKILKTARKYLGDACYDDELG